MPTDTAPHDARMMRVLLAAMERSNAKLRAGTIPEWLAHRWEIDGDALAFFANYANEHATYPTKPDAFAAGFLLALEIADDPDIGRPTLTVA